MGVAEKIGDLRRRALLSLSNRFSSSPPSVRSPRFPADFAWFLRRLLGRH
ncbi:hypothetical protein RISK_001741 [Rhodopirellula islandica]|uniref:Uncharacterized protein n=1 Tax=Rhodopirellula islandica TaxID=595434 RepID=A0A0J1BJ15_RHOIS|nr:hypothetical protein RISK_001741 [Rhodopirellula islandica]